MKKILIFSLSILLFAACGGDLTPEDKAKQAEAIGYHHKSTEAEAMMLPNINRLDSYKAAVLNMIELPNVNDSIKTELKGLTTDMDKLIADFGEWQKGIIEVPGMPHNHDHAHGKRCNHDNPLEVSWDDMVDIQKSLVDKSNEMEKRYNDLTSVMKSLDKKVKESM